MKKESSMSVRSFQLVVLMVVVCSVCLTSCGINSSILFKTAKGEFAISDSIPMRPESDYRISIDDKLAFTISTNQGAKIIDQLSGMNGTTSANAGNSADYLVRKNGQVELPLLGNVKAAGYTVEEFEDTLQSLFSKEYQNPFVQVKITNKRVLVFPGEAGKATVVPLLNENTTLMEALAQAGGITERGKANSIKIMRREKGTRKVYQIDLSTIEGLQYADIVLQANDYIYIEPEPRIASEIVKEIAPVISIFSSALVIFTVISNLK
jgi:polysaccharide export outer membrane protein